MISSPSVPLAKSATSTLLKLLPVPLASNVLLVKVSVVALPTSVSVAAGNVSVVVPATAVALTVVVPLVAPAYTNVPELNVLVPVFVCVDARIISPEPPPSVISSNSSFVLLYEITSPPVGEVKAAVGIATTHISSPP